MSLPTAETRLFRPLARRSNSSKLRDEAERVAVQQFLYAAAIWRADDQADVVAVADAIGDLRVVKRRSVRPFVARQREHDIPREDYAGLLVSLAREEWPDTSAYDDPEIVWRLNRSAHAGLIITSPSIERIEHLLGEYTARFVHDFLATLPEPKRPTS